MWMFYMFFSFLIFSLMSEMFLFSINIFFFNLLVLTLLKMSFLPKMLILMSSFVWFLSMISLESKTMILMSQIIISICIMFFNIKNLLMFYTLFELSLIPILVVVCAYANQMERVEGGFIMFIFTFLGTLPFLFMLMFIDFMDLEWKMTSLSELQCLFLSLCFLIKTPLWAFHQWLTKTHVESPTSASVLLTGILMKMGTFGLVRLNKCIISSYWWIICLCICAISLGTMTGILCVDSKKMISYSSISHMNMGLLLSCFDTTFAKFSLSGIVLTHSLSSCLMFTILATLYHFSGSRLIILYSNISHISGKENFLFMINLLNNMATPAFVSFFPEFFSISNIFNMSIFGFILTGCYMLFVCFLSMYLYLISSKFSNLDKFSHSLLLLIVFNWAFLLLI